MPEEMLEGIVDLVKSTKVGKAMFYSDYFHKARLHKGRGRRTQNEPVSASRRGIAEPSKNHRRVGIPANSTRN